MRRSAVLLLVLVAIALPSAQTPDGAAVGFEAASIKLTKSGGNTSGLRRSPGGRFEVTNMPLAFLIEFAYQLQNYELQAGPSWMTSDRWDIIAKMAGDPPPTCPPLKQATAARRPESKCVVSRAPHATRAKEDFESSPPPWLRGTDKPSSETKGYRLE